MIEESPDSPCILAPNVTEGETKLKHVEGKSGTLPCSAFSRQDKPTQFAVAHPERQMSFAHPNKGLYPRPAISPSMDRGPPEVLFKLKHFRCVHVPACVDVMNTAQSVSVAVKNFWQDEQE